MQIGRGAQRGVKVRASAQCAARSYPITLRSNLGRQTLVRYAHCPASAKTRCPWPAGTGLRWLLIVATSCLWVFAQAFILGSAHALPPPPTSRPSLSPAKTSRPVESSADACQVSDLFLVVSAPTKAVANCRKRWGLWGVIGMGALLLIWAAQSLESVHKVMGWLWVAGSRGWLVLLDGVGRLLGGFRQAVSRHPSPRVSPPAKRATPSAQPQPAQRAMLPIPSTPVRQQAPTPTEAPTAPALAEWSKVNPFGDRGCIRDPARFFNRERELAEIFDELRKGSSLSLVGEAQVGKSSLLAMIAARAPRELQRDPADFISIDMQVIRNEDEFFDALCEKLGLGVTMRGLALERALRERRAVVCLDEIEKMTNRLYFSGEERMELRGHANGPDSPLTLVIASRSPLASLFDDDPRRTSPLADLCGRPHRLGPFSQSTSEAFLLHRLQGHSVTFSAKQRQGLHEQSDGHPGRLQSAAAELYRQLTLA